MSIDSKVTACQVSRKPIASQVLDDLMQLSERAHSLADRINGKLHPVCLQSGPEVSNSKIGTDVKTCPPYFNELREQYSSIKKALDSIEETMSRCEI